MVTLNPSTFAAVVEKAAHDAANHPRWLQAIARAIIELTDNPFVERNPWMHEGRLSATDWTPDQIEAKRAQLQPRQRGPRRNPQSARYVTGRHSFEK